MYNPLKNLFIVLFVAVPLSNTFGAKLQKELSRIAYGEDASIEEHPYMASIYVPYGGYVCSASLISSTCVLTAAHCLYTNTKIQIPKENITVRAGSIMISTGGYTQSVADYRIPSNYNPSIDDMDIAVLKLNGALEGEIIKPIKVNTEDIRFNKKTKITVAGWGDTETIIGREHPLKKAQLLHFDLNRCRRIYRLSFDHSFCAMGKGKFTADGKKIENTCGGDSGGPAIVNGEQVGISSTAQDITCGQAHAPSTFTRLGNKEISTFLKQAMKTLQC